MVAARTSRAVRRALRADESPGHTVLGRDRSGETDRHALDLPVHRRDLHEHGRRGAARSGVGLDERDTRDAADDVHARDDAPAARHEQRIAGGEVAGIQRRRQDGEARVRGRLGKAVDRDIDVGVDVREPEKTTSSRRLDMDS